MADLRFVVVRRDVDPTLPLAEGDPVTTYELVDPWPYADLAPHSGRHVELDEYAAVVRRYSNQDQHWRIHKVHRCDCKSRRQVAQVLVHRPTHRLWVTTVGERPPSALGDVPHDEKGDGMPLHGSEGEQPCPVGVATCGGCGRSWLVVAFDDRAELLLIAGGTHGAAVAAGD